MKPALSYYGGKQRMAKWIISHFPQDYEQMHYIEPFAGGLSVLFDKHPSATETISDKAKRIYRFYKVLRDENLFKKFIKKLSVIIKDENTFLECRDIVRERKKVNCESEFAFALFYLNFLSVSNCQTSFSMTKESRFKKRGTIQIENRAKLLPLIQKRFRNVQVLNRDALKVIEQFDFKEALFYLDPPYPEAQQGHYSGYKNQDFNNLIELVKTIKGKFLLSCYEKDWMKFDNSWIRKYYQSTTTSRCLTIGFKSSKTN